MSGIWICRGVAIQLVNRTPREVQMFEWCSHNMQTLNYVVNGSLYGVRYLKTLPRVPLEMP